MQDAEPWASCIGGATQVDAYLNAIEEAGLRAPRCGTTPSTGSCPTPRQGATRTYGIKSISLLAMKPALSGR